MAININLHVHHHYPDYDKQFVALQEKLDQVLKGFEDLTKLGHLADKLDTSTNTLKKAVDENQPNPDQAPGLNQ